LRKTAKLAPQKAAGQYAISIEILRPTKSGKLQQVSPNNDAVDRRDVEANLQWLLCTRKLLSEVFPK
jgi:hypothetical protein